MTEIKVGMENTTMVSSIAPGWRVLTAEEIAAGCTGNPKDFYDSIGERTEGCFVGKIVSRILAKFGIIDNDGFCSTYREWHILCRGIYSGFNTVLGAKFDPIPSYWEDEAQYYEGGQEFGYIVKNGALYIPTSAIGTLIMTNLPTIFNLIKTTFNM